MSSDTGATSPDSQFSLTVVPNAKRLGVELSAQGWKVRVTAPAVEGKANQALIAYLAEVLRVRQRDLILLHGSRAHRKTVGVFGLAESLVTQRLTVAANSAPTSGFRSS